MNRQTRRNLIFGRTLFEADNGANSPGGTNSGTQDTKPNDSRSNSSQTDVQKLIDAITQSQRVQGNPDEAYRVFAGQIVKKDQRIAELEKNVISDADKARLQAADDLLQTYGVQNFDALKTRIEAGDTAAANLSQRDKSDTMRAACEAAGIDFNDFSTRKGVDDWSYEVKEQQRDGKPVKVPYVTVKDEAGKDVTKPLAEHATAAFPTLAKAEAGGSNQGGTRWAGAGATGNANTATIYDAIRNEVKGKAEAAPKPEEASARLASAGIQ